MSMKIMKKAIVSSIGAAALLGAASAQAQFTTIDPVQSEYTFSGATQLTQFGVPANCTLNLVGEVVITGSGGVTIDVTGGAVTGSGFGCGSVTLSNFPWTANVPASAAPADPTDPVTVTFEDVSVAGPLGNCGTTDVDAVFSNGDPISEPSSFDFDATIGACTVNGILENDDVNVY
ncbi:hypothetical protein ASALC70_00604 [Alcanivorax sp. ALC70]|nr:hypothetical protein ASALC70_00604 [Alcanivorax sp. ALC70]